MTCKEPCNERVDFEITTNKRIIEILIEARAYVGTDEDGTVKKVRVRYRPREVMAVYLDVAHIIVDGKKGRKSGWFIPGPDKKVFFIPEDKFNQSFEIIKED